MELLFPSHFPRLGLHYVTFHPNCLLVFTLSWSLCPDQKWVPRAGVGHPQEPPEVDPTLPGVEQGWSSEIWVGRDRKPSWGFSFVWCGKGENPVGPGTGWRGEHGGKS